MSCLNNLTASVLLRVRRSSRINAQGIFSLDHIDLSHKRIKFVLTIVLLSLGITGLYLVLTPKIYKTDALVRFDKYQGSLSALTHSGIRTLDAAKQNPMQRELEMLLDRSIMGQVVEDLNLMVEYSPRYFPLIGEAIARQYDKRDGVAKAWWGFSHWAWGGEKLKVAQFDVPDRYLNRAFSLVALQDGQFQLLGPKGNVLTGGGVGEVISADIGESKPVLIQVSELDAELGTEFELIRTTSLMAIKRLQMAFSLQEVATDADILRVQLTGKDAEQLAKLVNDIAESYVNAVASRQTAKISLPVKSSIVEFAEVPKKPIWPKPSVLFVISALLGFVVAYGGVFFRHFLRQLNRPDLHENELSQPLARKTAGKKLCDSEQLPSQDSPGDRDSFKTSYVAWAHQQMQEIHCIQPKLPLAIASDTEESFCVPDIAFDTSLNSGDAKVIMLCSSGLTRSMSSISSVLAASLASSTKRVLIIDTDRQNCNLKHARNIDKQPGLSDFFLGKASLGEIIMSMPEGFDFIPRGSVLLNSAEMLETGVFAQTLEQLKTFYNHIVIDLPSILEFSAGAVIGQYADATYMVMDTDTSSTQTWKTDFRHLQLAGVKLNGFLINDTEQSSVYHPYCAYTTMENNLKRITRFFRQAGRQRLARWFCKMPSVEGLPHVEPSANLDDSIRV